MNINIRKAKMNDANRIGYIHYNAWLETYRGIVDDEYLDNLSLDSRINNVKNYYQKCYIAEFNNEIVGFATCDRSRDEDLDDTLEIIGIYILKDYHKRGIGKALIAKCISSNNLYNNTSLWVSKDNHNAIGAYGRIGFLPDGNEKIYKIGKNDIKVIRMIKENLK